MFSGFSGALRAFIVSDRGTITVDWLVLSAGMVGLGMATVMTVSGGVEDLSFETAEALAETDPLTSPFLGDALANWTAGNWEQHNPGIYDSYTTWMAGFTDEQLMAHYANTAQYANTAPNSGHPIDTYHDEFYIARDEAITRGLIPPDEPIPAT